MVTNQRITERDEGEEQKQTTEKAEGKITERVSDTNFKELQEEGNMNTIQMIAVQY